MLLRYPLLGIFILGLLILMPGTTTLPMIDRDGALFAQASKQMVESGDYWQIKMQEKKRHRKPPGYYWLQAASVNLFGSDSLNDPFAYRIPALLTSLLSLMLLAFFSRRLFDVKTAVVASLVLAGNLLFIFEAHFAATDSSLLACVVAIFGCLWVAYSHKKTLPLGYQLLLWSAVTLGILIKGVAPLFALTTIVLLFAADRDIRWLNNTGWQWGIPATIVLTLAWVLPMNHYTDSNFIWDMIRIDFLPKLQQGVESHGNPPGYYFILFHVLFWPFTLFFWPMIMTAKNNFSTPRIRFLAAWCVANWVAIECVPTKLPGYTMPLFPAIAVLTGIAILNAPKLPTLIKRLHQGYVIVWSLVSILLISSFVSIPHLLNEVTKNLELFFMIVSAVIAVTSCVLVIKGNRYGGFIGLLGLAMVFNTVLFDSLLPRSSSLWITESIYQQLQTRPTLKRLYSVDYHEPSLIFRYGTWRVKFINLGDVETQLAKTEPSAFLIPASQFEPYQNQLTVIDTIQGFHYSKGKWKSYVLACQHCQEAHDPS